MSTGVKGPGGGGPVDPPKEKTLISKENTDTIMRVSGYVALGVTILTTVYCYKNISKSYAVQTIKGKITTGIVSLAGGMAAGGSAGLVTVFCSTIGIAAFNSLGFVPTEKDPVDAPVSASKDKVPVAAPHYIPPAYDRQREEQRQAYARQEQQRRQYQAEQQQAYASQQQQQFQFAQRQAQQQFYDQQRQQQHQLRLGRGY